MHLRRAISISIIRQNSKNDLALMKYMLVLMLPRTLETGSVPWTHCISLSRSLAAGRALKYYQHHAHQL